MSSEKDLISPWYYRQRPTLSEAPVYEGGKVALCESGLVEAFTKLGIDWPYEEIKRLRFIARKNPRGEWLVRRYTVGPVSAYPPKREGRWLNEYTKPFNELMGVASLGRVFRSRLFRWGQPDFYHRADIWVEYETRKKRRLP